jgi:large subunit ribosomal protein L10
MTRTSMTGMPQDVGCLPATFGGSGCTGQANRGRPGISPTGLMGNPAVAVRRLGPSRRRDLDRLQKRDFVGSLASVFADTSMVVVTHNLGLNAAEVTDLRRRMRAAGATFRVTKNRLASLALDGTRFDGIAPLMKGPTALAWSHDPVAVAKVTVEFAKTNDKLVLIGGALGARMLDASGVQALAALPSLEALRAGLLGMIQTPATRIAGILVAPAGQLARVFGAYAKKDEQAEAA